MRALFKAVAACLVLASAGAAAAPVTWTDWLRRSDENAIIGRMGSIDVYVAAAPGSFFASTTQLGCGTNWWTQPNPAAPAYTGGTASNAPTACEQIGVAEPGSFTVTFSSPVDNLYMALLSVGQPGYTVTYDFDRSFTVDSSGQGFWGHGTYSLGAGDQLHGAEFHGTLLFTGGVTSLTFSTTPFEFWHAFTFGFSTTPGGTVPEGGTLPMLALGLALIGLYARRRRS